MALLGTLKLQWLPLLRPTPSNRFSKPLHCSSVQEQAITLEAGIQCDPCNGRGWLICDFCKGQKTNVKSETSRIYRRCPSCRAVGYLLCSKCKVFKCVTYPDDTDGEN